MNQSIKKTSLITKLAMMTAISIVLLLVVRIPFPPAPFLVYDPADVPIYITAFAFGPVAGIVVTFIVSFIQAFMLGGDGVYGFIMHFVATGLVSVIIGMMYNRSKSKKTAITALVIGVLAMTAIMCVLNLVVTSAFMGVDTKAVLAMLPTVIIPFNLIKAGVNSILTFLLYKRISGFLHNNIQR